MLDWAMLAYARSIHTLFTLSKLTHQKKARKRRSSRKQRPEIDQKEETEPGRGPRFRDQRTLDKKGDDEFGWSCFEGARTNHTKEPGAEGAFFSASRLPIQKTNL